jgi:hypothetical protein
MGNTIGALSGYSSFSNCGNTYADNRAVWYKTTGHDKVLKLALMDEAFEHEIRMAVFTGECDDLKQVVCWLSNWRSRVPMWAGYAAVEYIIFIGGLKDVGSFTFDLDVSQKTLFSQPFHSRTPKYGAFSTQLLTVFRFYFSPSGT